jgi:hypothetical protein
MISLSKNKKHVIKNEQETREILNRMNRRNNNITLLGEVRKILNEVAETEKEFQYYEEPSIANNKTFYILRNNEIFGEFYIRFRTEENSINFIHNNVEFSYDWNSLKSNLPKLKELITAYIAGFDEFENLI